jgi:hypothetical protein
MDGSIRMSEEAAQVGTVRRFKFKNFAIMFGGGAVAVFLKMGFPAFFDKGHVVEDLLHSGAISWSLAAIAIGLPFLAAGGSGKVPLLRFAGTAIGLILLFCSVHFFQTYRFDAALAQRGVTAQARVSRFFTGACSKHGCSRVAEYVYTPTGSQASFNGYFDMGTDRQTRRSVESSMLLPIIYDRAYPARSEVNTVGAISGVSSEKLTSEILFALGLAILLGLTPLIIEAWRNYRPDVMATA